MNDITILTEDEIERIVEKHIEALDHRLMNNDMTQQEYEQAVIIVDKWASQQYRNLRRMINEEI
jgi:ATP-dependent Clp protease ATP-binding subunit ClpA